VCSAVPPATHLCTSDLEHSIVTGWRELGRAVWTATGISAPIEPLIPQRAPPWETVATTITFGLDLGTPLPPGASDTQKRQLASLHLASLPQCATWVWTDGSAKGGVVDGGAGAFVDLPDGEHVELRSPAGRLCSSFRAELVALQAALSHLVEHPTHVEDPIVLCTDSMSALAALREGPAAQTSPMGVSVWRSLATLARADRRIHLQWVPSHCDLAGNERADNLAKEASALPQEDALLDVRTVARAAARWARDRSIKEWPAGWFRTLMGDRLPPPVTGMDRATAVDVHQLRAGHWSGSARYLHWIGRNPSRECLKCDSLRCRGGWCRICREEADTPEHVLLRCPPLMIRRERLTGSIHPDPTEVRGSNVVAALAAASRTIQSRLATPR